MAVFFMAVLLSGTIQAKPASVLTLPSRPFPEILPETEAGARKAGLAIAGGAQLAAGVGLSKDDAVTFLVSMAAGQTVKQWILMIQVVELPPAADKPKKELTFYTTTGAELRYATRNVSMDVRLVGPFESGKTAEVAIARKTVKVNGDYLALGFDQATEAILRMREERQKMTGPVKFDFQVAGKPFSPEQIAPMKEFAREIGLTVAQERALLGAGLALPEFVRLAIRTPGLQDILREMVEVSWWSLLAAGGKTKIQCVPLFRQAEKLSPASPDGSPAQYSFPFVLQVNGDAALVCRLFVVAPWSPFATTGGVVGLQALRPGEGEGPWLSVRLLASRRGADTGVSAAMPATEPIGSK